MSREYAPVPVIEAQRMAELYRKDQVIIITWDQTQNRAGATTFGVTAKDKVNAIAAADLCLAALKVDRAKEKTHEDFRTDFRPAVQKEAVDILTSLAAVGEAVLDSVLITPQKSAETKVALLTIIRRAEILLASIKSYLDQFTRESRKT